MTEMACEILLSFPFFLKLIDIGSFWFFRKLGSGICFGFYFVNHNQNIFLDMAAMLSSCLQEYKNKKQLIGFVTNNIDSFAVFVIDSNTNESVTFYLYEPNDAQNFMDEISTFKDLFKAFIFDLFHLNLQSTSFKNSFNYCQKLKEKLEELQIPNYFLTELNYLFASMLAAAEIDIDFDDTVLIILPHDTTTLKNAKKTFKLTVAEFKFTQNGYELIQQKITPELNFKTSPELLFQQICGTSKTQHVVISSVHSKKVPFKKIFKSAKNLTILYEKIVNYHNDFIAETCKWLFDKSYIKYYILPVCDRSLHVYGYYGSEKNILDILKIDMNEPLPITKTETFTKSIPEFRLMFKHQFSQSEKQTTLANTVHAYEITVTIDEENFTDFDSQELVYINFNTLPGKFNTLLKSKIPVIGFFDNSSYIALCKNDGYEFLQEWNGMFGTDCFISFDQKKPKYGESAKEIIKTKHTFVVFDLLKIMSMPKDKIKIDKTWEFTITKDSEHPVLLEFDNFDGTKKRAPPEFLMALFLRQHFKATEIEIGEKPKNIAFWILGNKFTEAEIQRIKDGLEESCKLLRIDCSFIDLPNFEYDYIKLI